MDIIVSQMQGRVPVTVLRINERVNLGNATALEETARIAFQNGMRNLVIDLTDVPSITSAGLRAIQVVNKLLGADPAEVSDTTARPPPGGGSLKSRHLKLVNTSPYVLRVLQTAGFDTFLDIHDSVQDAVASF